MRSVKFRWTYAVLTCVLCAFAAGRSVSAQSPAMQRLYDPKGRFSIEYPAAWKMTVHVIDIGTVYSGVSPAGYVDVSVGEGVAYASAQEFAQRIEPKYREAHPTYRSLQQARTTIAGQDAYYIYYTVTDKGIETYEIRVYVRTAPPQGPARVYWLSGGTLNRPEQVRDNFPLILQIIQSFRPA